MKKETGNRLWNSRKACRVGVWLIVAALSGLFGCGQAQEYTVAVSESGTDAEQLLTSGESESAQTQESDRTTVQTAGTDQTDAQTQETSSIYVDVGGAVRNPGVYILDDGARVYEGIEAAGGLLNEACTKALNQAQVLTDGQKLYVPTTEEWESEDGEWDVSGAVLETQEQEDSLININTADASKLCELPGVGESRAQAIIAYREENGPFTDITEIQNVSGIKSGLFEKMKDKIKVE